MAKPQAKAAASDIGVLLVNLGTPEAPTAKAVKAYLAEFLWDQRVIDTPRPLWWLILHLFILRVRPAKVARLYQSIWSDDGSPLLTIGRRQQAALQQALKDSLGREFPVELAMTYGTPSMEEAGLALRDAGVEKVLVLPLYPQYSATTTAAVFDRLGKALARCPHLPELRMVREYHAHAAYIEALAESIRDYWSQHGRGERLLMSFHGIPQRYAERGDPYPEQCRQTARLLAAELELSDDEWQCSFQSRFGPAAWVQPYTDKTLEAWGKEKLSRVDVVCPAFAADCLETLEEIAQQNREAFQAAGGEEYHYIPALNDEPAHIELLRQLVAQHTQGW